MDEAEAELRAIYQQKVKEEYGDDFYKLLYPKDDKQIEVVTHVVGRPPSIQQILYVSWYQKTFLDLENFKQLRKAGVTSQQPDVVPLYLRLMLSYQRKSRKEAIKAMVGDSMQKARSMFSFRREPHG